MPLSTGHCLICLHFWGILPTIWLCPVIWSTLLWRSVEKTIRFFGVWVMFIHEKRSACDAILVFYYTELRQWILNRQWVSASREKEMPIHAYRHSWHAQIQSSQVLRWIVFGTFPSWRMTNKTRCWLMLQVLLCTGTVQLGLQRSILPSSLSFILMGSLTRSQFLTSQRVYASLPAQAAMNMWRNNYGRHTAFIHSWAAVVWSARPLVHHWTICDIETSIETNKKNTFVITLHGS